MKRSTQLFLAFLLSIFSLNLPAQCSWYTVGDTVNFAVKNILPDEASTSFIAGGTFTKIGGLEVAGIAQWSGSGWTHIAGSGIYGSEVNVIIPFSNGYVAGGNFSMIDSIPCENVAYFNGTNWSPIGGGIDYTGGVTVSTLTIYNGELIAAGNFINAEGNPVNNIARWNGSAWLPLGSGTNGSVNTLCVYNGRLYAGGTFTNAGGVSVNNIAAWDGTNWNDVGGGVSSYTGGITVSTLTVYNEILYVGGKFDMVANDTIEDLARWNDSTWSDVGGGLKYTGAITVSTITMSEVDKRLIVSAAFKMNSNNTVKYQLQAWDENAWEILDAETTEPVDAIVSLEGVLFVGGEFRGIGSATTTNYLAGWDCGSGKMHDILVQGEQPEKMMFEIYPNPVADHINMKLYSEADEMRENAFSFTLTDITGRQVSSSTIKGSDLKIERGGIPAGIYYYELKNLSTGNVQKGKVVFK